MELGAIGDHGSCQHIVYGGPVDGRLAGARGLTSRGEQTERGHATQASGRRSNVAGTLGPMSIATVTRLLALRHGESEWNALGRWQGQADPPLTEVGRRQAMAVAEQLGPFDAIWSSTLQRAAHTATIIAEGLGTCGVRLEPGLMEASFGPWQGLTVHEIEENWPGYLASHRRPDGAEQPDVVSGRAFAAFRRIAAENPGGMVLAITHAGLIRSVRSALSAPDVRFTNLGGCWLNIHTDGRVEAGEPVQLVDPITFGDTL